MNSSLIFPAVFLAICIGLIIISTQIENYGNRRAKKAYKAAQKDIALRLHDLSFSVKEDIKLRNALILISNRIQQDKYYSNDDILRHLKEIGDKSIFELGIDEINYHIANEDKGNNNSK